MMHEFVNNYYAHVTVQGIAGYKGKIPVAVKTLTSRDPSIISKFKEEAGLMRKFVHPNIVSLLGIYFYKLETVQNLDISLFRCLY